MQLPRPAVAGTTRPSRRTDIRPWRCWHWSCCAPGARAWATRTEEEEEEEEEEGLELRRRMVATEVTGRESSYQRVWWWVRQDSSTGCA
jgi:hypothetical protein